MSDRVGCMNGTIMSRWSMTLSHHSSSHMQGIKHCVIPLKMLLSRPNSFFLARHSIRPCNLAELAHISCRIKPIPLQPTLILSFGARKCIHTRHCMAHLLHSLI